MADADERPVIYEFDIPEAYRTWPDCPKTIGMVELDYKQDKRVRARVKFRFEQLQDELIKESIIELDGKKIPGSRSEIEGFYDRSKQRLRSWLAGAYQKVNGTGDEADETFQTGCRVKA